jgi:hypothetical protein
MIYFFINMPLNEIVLLESKLPKGCFCFFQVQSATNRYYGMIKKDAFLLLKEILSNESQQNLELLDKNVFQLFFLQNISDNITCIGNRRLMVHLSDENG